MRLSAWISPLALTTPTVRPSNLIPSSIPNLTLRPLSPYPIASSPFLSDCPLSSQADCDNGPRGQGRCPRRDGRPRLLLAHAFPAEGLTGRRRAHLLLPLEIKLRDKSPIILSTSPTDPTSDHGPSRTATPSLEPSVMRAVPPSSHLHLCTLALFTNASSSSSSWANPPRSLLVRSSLMPLPLFPPPSAG